MAITDLENMLTAVYLRFVLRDVFGKMVPGAVLLLAVSFSIAEGNGSAPLWHESSVVGWALFLGIAWILGFALQASGEWLGLLRNEPKNLTRQAFYEQLIEFHRLTRDDRSEAMQGERLLVIKEACGNGAMALAAAEMLWIARALGAGAEIASRATGLIVGISLAGGVVALWWMHHEHVKRHNDYVMMYLKSQGHPASAR